MTAGNIIKALWTIEAISWLVLFVIFFIAWFDTDL